MEEDLFQNSDTNRGGYDFPYAQNLRVPGAFPLERGGELQDLNITFETYGTLNEAKDNAVLLCHALTGDSHVARHNKDDKEGWWDILVGPGKYVDTNRYFVICANNIGSCYGTTGPTSIDPKTGEPYGANFPVVTMEDNVEMQRIIMKHFGITQWLGIVGGSVGGMMSLIWSARYPNAVRGIAILATSPCLTSQALAFDIVGRNAITTDPNFNGGNYYGKQTPHVGLSLARMLGHITYLSRESMMKKFDEHRDEPRKIDTEFELEYSVGSYLAYNGDQFNERYDANSYIVQTRSCDLMNIGSSVEAIAEYLAPATCRWMVMSFSSDWLLPPFQSEMIVDALIHHKKSVSYCEIKSESGHDAFLLPNQLSSYGGFIEKFLKNLYFTRPSLQNAPEREAHYVADVVDTTPSDSAFLSDHYGRLYDGRIDIDSILELIPKHASVLDLGCGNGELLKRLRQRSDKARLMGIDRKEQAIQKCVARGLDVVQKDINNGLSAFYDGQFEYVVLSRTLQTVIDVEHVLEEMLRVGRRGIVSFPNSAYLPWRTQLYKNGRMPRTDAEHSWYNTDDVRFLTIADFHAFCEKKGYSVLQQITLDTEKDCPVLQNPNDNASMAIVVLTR